MIKKMNLRLKKKTSKIFKKSKFSKKKVRSQIKNMTPSQKILQKNKKNN